MSIDPSGALCLSLSCARNDLGAATNAVGQATASAASYTWKHRDVAIAAAGVGCTIVTSGVCGIVVAGVGVANAIYTGTQTHNWATAAVGVAGSLPLAGGVLGIVRFSRLLDTASAGSVTNILRLIAVKDTADFGLTVAGDIVGSALEK